MEVPVTEGQDVKQGALLAVIDPRPYQAALDTAMAKKQQDEAQLSNAKADLARYDSLVRRDFASRQQLDTQQAMVKQYTAAILGDDAQIEAARLNLSFCYITSPFDGRIGLRNVDPGNMVHSAEATPIISVTQIQPIAVTFTLPQDNLPAIMQAMETHALDVVVYASDNKIELDRGVLLTPGQHHRHHDRHDQAEGDVHQYAPKALARPVRERRLATRDRDQRHRRRRDGGAAWSGWALCLSGSDRTTTVSVQPIKVARQEGDVYVVASGLADGAVVVATGQSRLQAGAHVTVRDGANHTGRSSQVRRLAATHGGEPTT